MDVSCADHARSLQLRAQSSSRCYRLIIRHPLVEEDIDGFELTFYNPGSDIMAALEEPVLPSGNLVSLHIHAFALVGLFQDSDWTEFWFKLQWVRELVCYGTVSEPIEMIAVLKSLVSIPTDDLISDTDEDEEVNGKDAEDALRRGRYGTSNTCLHSLRFIGDCVIRGEDNIHQAALLVRHRGKWTKRWSVLELTLLVEVEDEPILDLGYWENIHGKDLNRMKSVADSFKYTFRMD